MDDLLRLKRKFVNDALEIIKQKNIEHPNTFASKVART